MIRPRLTLLVPLAAALLAGCAGFSDGNAVARFEQVELSHDDLSELMGALSPPDVTSDPTNAAAARESISLWVRIEAVKWRLDQDGIEIAPETIDEATTQMSSVVPRFAELSDRTRDYLVDAQAAFLTFAEVPPPSEDEIREFYERGPVESGLTCAAHILVATEEEADGVVGELAGGADFAAVAAERSLDTGSGQQGGALPCAPTASFEGTYVPPFVEAALAAEIGTPTAPVESQFGFHVIRLRTFAEAQPELDLILSPQEFTIGRAIEHADVYVDPRYGALERGNVVPLT